MVNLVNNCQIVDRPDLGEIISKLPATMGPQIPCYDDLYPEHWANDKRVEDRHREIVRMVQRWPTDEGSNVS